MDSSRDATEEGEEEEENILQGTTKDKTWNCLQVGEGGVGRVSPPLSADWTSREGSLFLRSE